MKRALLLGLILVFAVSMAWADATGSRRIYSATGTQDTGTMAVGGQKLFWTKSINVSEIGANATDSLAVMYKTSGTGSVSLHLEQSYQKSAIENVTSVDASYLITHDLDTNINDTDWHIATASTVSMPFIRFKVIGLSGNTSNNTIQIKYAK